MLPSQAWRFTVFPLFSGEKLLKRFAVFLDVRDGKPTWKPKDIRQLFSWNCESEPGNNQRIIFWKMQRQRNSFDQTVVDFEEEVKVVDLKKPSDYEFL